MSERYAILMSVSAPKAALLFITHEREPGRHRIIVRDVGDNIIPKEDQADINEALQNLAKSPSQEHMEKTRQTLVDKAHVSVAHANVIIDTIVHFFGQ